MEKKFNEILRRQGQLNQIVNDVRFGKIKLPEYEKELIEDWGSIVITATKEDWDYYTEKGMEEPLQVSTLLEKLMEKKKKRLY